MACAGAGPAHRITFTTPAFRKVYHGVNSGEIMLLINAVLYARGYEVQYAALQDGVPGPGQWSTS